MQLLRCEQRKSRPAWAQIESSLRAEHRQRSSSGAIISRLTFFKNEAKKIVILPHDLNVEAGVSPASPVVMEGRSSCRPLGNRSSTISRALFLTALCVGSMFANATATDVTGS